jgi:CDGSH-type Zn-finger protein
MINEKKLPARCNEDLPVGETMSYCRCWQSSDHPYCDGTHRKVNATTGDEVGPIIVSAVLLPEVEHAA